MIHNQDFDLYILDVNLPYKNGYKLCELIRSDKGDSPIIFLTAMGTTEDKLSGFDSGADDYIVKPFEFVELLARVRALLKRSKTRTVEHKILKVANLSMDLDAKLVKTKNGSKNKNEDKREIFFH